MEYVFNFKSFFANILMRWRFIVAISLIISIIFGVYYAESTRESNLDNDHLSYEIEIDNYNVEKQILVNKIEKLEKEIQEQEMNQRNSVLLQINPANKPVLKASYLISSLENEYENLESYYKTVLNNEDLYQDISASINIPTKYLREIITCNFLNNTQPYYVIQNDLSIENKEKKAVLELCIVGLEKNLADEAINIITSYLNTIRKIHTKFISLNKFEYISKTYYYQNDYDLKSYQSTQLQLFEENNLALYNANISLLDLKEPVKPTLQPLIKTVFTYIIFGFIGGIFLAVLFIVFYDFVNDKIVSPSQVETKYSLQCLSIVQSACQRIKVDQWIDKLNGYNHLQVSSASYIYQRILMDPFLINKNSIAKVFLTGGIDEEKYKDLTTALEDLNIDNKINFTYSNEYLSNNAHSLTKLSESDAVIILIQKNVTSYKVLESIINIIKNYKKENLGFIFF